MADRLRPIAYLLVPAITLALAVTALVALATPRTLIAARLWGGPTVAGPQSLRLQCARRAVGVEDSIPLGNLTVEIDGSPHPASCGPDGHAEVAISPSREGSFSLRVLHGSQVLGEGQARVSPAEWTSEAMVFPAAVPGGGSLPLRAQVVGGALVLERWGEVILRMPEELRAPGALKLSVSGGDLTPPQPHPEGLRMRVRPTFLTTSLEAQAPAGPDGKPGGAWEVQFPLATSVISAEELDLRDGTLRGRLRAPTPQPRAYLRVQDQRGRVAAATVPLLPDGQGGAQAPFSLPLPALQKPAWLITGTSPQAAGLTSLPWPIDPDPDHLDGRLVPDRLWLDGMAPAQRREASRLQRMLGAVGAVVVLGALAETLLLYERARAARLALQRHLEEAGEGSEVERLDTARGPLRLLQTLALVLFGFAVIGTLLVGKID